MAGYKLIIFEGGDCAGKSTIKKAFEKATNFRHLCVDRMFITSIVYNIHKERHADLIDQLYDDIDTFIQTFNPLFVVLKSDREIQKKRFENRGDWYIESVELEKIEAIYDEVVSYLRETYPKNVILLPNNDEDQMRDNVILISDMVNEMIEEEQKDDSL